MPSRRSCASTLTAGLCAVLLGACGAGQTVPVASQPSGPGPGPVTLPVSSPSAAAVSTPVSTSTPVTRLDPIGILDAVRAAVGDARSVRVAGRVGSGTGPGPAEIDAQLHRTGGSATVTSDGVRVELRRLRDAVYFRSDDPRAYASLVPPGEIGGLRGRWVRTTTADPRLGGLADLVSFDLVKGWAVGGGMTVVEPVTSRHGRQVLTLRNPATGARMVVSAEGKPLPLSLERDDEDVRGRLDFSDWDSDVVVDVPAAAADLTPQS